MVKNGIAQSFGLPRSYEFVGEGCIKFQPPSFYSNIRPMLEPGTIVTLPRTVTHNVVTEYGIAMLKGKSVWQRAEALIAISHTDFRDSLIKEAEEMKIFIKRNK